MAMFNACSGFFLVMEREKILYSPSPCVQSRQSILR